jgi:thiol-disulfide isomerase/thioredoxin
MNATGDTKPKLNLAGFPGRLGQILVAPGAALRRIDAQGGGFRDALLLVVLGTIALRLPQLMEALLGLSQLSQGALLRVVAVFSNEARDAALVVIPASLLITVLAGRRRDPSLDLELGAACFAPFFVLRAVVRVIAGGGHLAEGTLPPAVGYAPAAAWAALVCAKAVMTARARAPRAAADGDAAASPAAPGDQAPTLAPELPPAPAVRAGALALALLVAGLGSNVVWASRHFDALRPMAHGEAAPDFELPRLDGRADRLSLGALHGKVVLLDFWATWCPPCLQMMPILHDLHRDFGARGVEIVGINSDGGGTTAAEVQEFLRGNPAPYPVVLDDGSANRAYKVRALPQMVLVGRDGAVRQVFIGYTSRSTLATALTKALDEGPAGP